MFLTFTYLSFIIKSILFVCVRVRERERVFFKTVVKNLFIVFSFTVKQKFCKRMNTASFSKNGYVGSSFCEESEFLVFSLSFFCLSFGIHLCKVDFVNLVHGVLIRASLLHASFWSHVTCLTQNYFLSLSLLPILLNRRSKIRISHCN